MESFNQLVEIVKKLRGPDGCPWDKEQTHRSLTPYAIEEAHELEEAIYKGEAQHIKEELGDLLFQSVLHAQIASETGEFTIDDVLQYLNHKMTSRHPHVFADVKVGNSDEVVQNWEEIKKNEKGNKDKDPMDIPATFPALLRAQKIGKRTHKLNFDWDNPQQVMAQVVEEMGELSSALHDESIEPNKDALADTNREEEIGDLLFTVVQLARHMGLDAEKALRLANEKFIGRFQRMMKLRPDFVELSLQEKEELWNKVKGHS